MNKENIKQLEETKKDNSSNKHINLQADILSDLPIDDKQGDETKGGGGARDYTTVSGKITSIAVDE